MFIHRRTVSGHLHVVVSGITKSNISEKLKEKIPVPILVLISVPGW